MAQQKIFLIISADFQKFNTLHFLKIFAFIFSSSILFEDPPGHLALVSQGTVLVLAPIHVAVAGEHCLLLVRVPEPQVTEQEVSCQVNQLPVVPKVIMKRK